MCKMTDLFLTMNIEDKLYLKFKSLFYDEIMTIKTSPDNRYIAVHASVPETDSSGENLMVFKQVDDEIHLLVYIPNNCRYYLDDIEWSQTKVTFSFASKWGNYVNTTINLTPNGFNVVSVEY